MNNIKPAANDKYVLLSLRFEYCKDCMYGSSSECSELIQLDGCFFCAAHDKFLKPMRLSI